VLKINYLLGYPNLKIYQDSEWFNFSLDSVLLANFVNIKKNTKKILDIGTGNAVIPIILSTKTTAEITGVEIQEDIYKLGQLSISENGLDSKIKLICTDIKQYAKNQESDVYDIITCNPPYFKICPTSHLNENIHKMYARHEILLNLQELMQVSKKLLKNNGSLYLVHRPERLIDIIEIARKNNLEPKNIQFIYPKKGSIANMLLIELTKNGNSGLKILEPLYVFENNNKYTKEIEDKFN
jgi:tRNA1(Val) A37 N6-methylase TrmN6